MNTTFPFVLLFCLTFGTLNAQTMQAPKAKKIEKKLSVHGDTRIDDYYWLNERENPEVIKYLEDENAYTKLILNPTEQFQKDLFEELKGRIKQDDETVPYLYNGYWYQTKYITGGEYPIHIRRKDKTDEEDIIFNVNELAKPYDYYQLTGVAVTLNNELATFGVDTLSRRIYTIRVKNLKTGEILGDVIENTTGGAVWANDNKTFYYTRKDDALRPYQIWRHTLGTDQKEDTLVYEEKDETFVTFIYKTKSRDYIVIGSSSTVSNEYRFIPANDPNAEWKIFQKRERDLEYSFDHLGDYFYVQTNKDKATNFKIMKTPVTATSKENWVDVVQHRESVLIEGFDLFKDYLVVEERSNGLVVFNVIPWEGKSSYFIPFDEEAYSVGSTTNIEINTTKFRFVYNSMTTPASVIEFDLATKEKSVLKEQEVLGGFDKNNYETKRLFATARDGKKIPISIVYRKDTKISSDTPLLLYAYGSYGYTVDASFSSKRLTLLDRGFVYAIAHIRGGEYLGREWYEDGKMLHKKNTFYDFIDASKFLIRENYTSQEHLYAMGGSAGGLLMGAVINYNPELYKGVIAAVPFVDVVTTMLDDSIPLTTGEYDEWGNPNEKVYYDYMKSYSPYDNVEKKKYPNLLVTTGLHDSQVQYWEPAKWVAKLREYKTDDNILLLETNMSTGHGGASGRFESLKEDAMEFAFIFMLEGISK